MSFTDILRIVNMLVAIVGVSMTVVALRFAYQDRAPLKKANFQGYLIRSYIERSILRLIVQLALAGNVFASFVLLHTEDLMRPLFQFVIAIATLVISSQDLRDRAIIFRGWTKPKKGGLNVNA